MHEMSIAEAIWDLAHSQVPPGAILRIVRVRAGPLRAIEPQSMQWAWEALSGERGACDIALELTTLSWRMRCEACGRQWNAPEIAERCGCGSACIRLVGGDELQLVSIEVDDLPAPAREIRSLS